MKTPSATAFRLLLVAALVHLPLTAAAQPAGDAPAAKPAEASKPIPPMQPVPTTVRPDSIVPGRSCTSGASTTVVSRYVRAGSVMPTPSRIHRRLMRDRSYLDTWARLKPGVTVAQGQAIGITPPTGRHVARKVWYRFTAGLP